MLAACEGIGRGRAGSWREARPGLVGLMTTLWWMDDLPRIQCPTLLVAPGAETVGHGDNYEKMRQRIPDAELLTYPGLPHNICDAVPDRCAADVRDFLHRRFGEG